ncbi:hypothetical protein GCM10020258_11810 [Sphingomonas yabuuchiae]
MAALHPDRSDASPDPRRAELAALWAQGDAAQVVDALFGHGGSMAGQWRPTEAQRQVLVREIEQ